MALSRRGLTFVELLIAATMLSILFVGLSGHLRGGIEVWRRATHTVEALQRQRVALDQFEQDLVRAIPATVPRDPSLQPSFEADHLRWWTVVPAAAQQTGRVRLVSYACNQVNGVAGLWKVSQSVGEAREQMAAEPVRLLAGCEGLSIRYAYLPAEGEGPIEWQADWEFPDALPKLLEVSVRLSSGHEVKRTMMIPIGVLEPRPS